MKFTYCTTYLGTKKCVRARTKSRVIAIYLVTSMIVTYLLGKGSKYFIFYFTYYWKQGNISYLVDRY